MTRQEVSIPDALRWDEVVERRFVENAPYYLKAFVRSVRGRTVEFEGREAGNASVLQSMAEMLVQRIVAELRDAAETILVEYDGGAPRYVADPAQELLASGAMVRTGRGRFVYGGLLLRVMESLDRLVESFAVRSDAERQLYPATVSADTLIRSGYLRAFPQHAYFVAPTGLGGECLEGIASSEVASDLDSTNARGWYGAHDQVLAPTVCYHCFESQQGRYLPGPHVFTAMNHCSRFEIDAEASLARLHTFRMRELIGFGPPEHVAEMLDRAIDWSTALLRRWGIGYRLVTATDPFFAGVRDGRAFYQSTFALKRELRVRLPFSGSWLAFASFNNHQQSYTRVFGITGPTPMASGCVGWGHERFAYGLLATVGLVPHAWPDSLRMDLGFTEPKA